MSFPRISVRVKKSVLQSQVNRHLAADCSVAFIRLLDWKWGFPKEVGQCIFRWKGSLRQLFILELRQNAQQMYQEYEIISTYALFWLLFLAISLYSHCNFCIYINLSPYIWREKHGNGFGIRDRLFKQTNMNKYYCIVFKKANPQNIAIKHTYG